MHIHIIVLFHWNMRYFFPLALIENSLYTLKQIFFIIVDLMLLFLWTQVACIDLCFNMIKKFLDFQQDKLICTLIIQILNGFFGALLLQKWKLFFRDPQLFTVLLKWDSQLVIQWIQLTILLFELLKHFLSCFQLHTLESYFFRVFLHFL